MYCPFTLSATLQQKKSSEQFFWPISFTELKTNQNKLISEFYEIIDGWPDFWERQVIILSTSRLLNEIAKYGWTALHAHALTKNPRVTLLDTPDLLSWFLGHTEFPSTYSTEPVTNHTQNSVGMTLRRFARTATLNMSFSRLCSAYIRPEHLVIGHNSMLRGYAKISKKPLNFQHPNVMSLRFERDGTCLNETIVNKISLSLTDMIAEVYNSLNPPIKQKLLHISKHLIEKSGKASLYRFVGSKNRNHRL